MATVSFLFWNIRRALGTRFHESLRRLTHRGIDVFLFAEPPVDDGLLLSTLNSEASKVYYRVPSISDRLMLFSSPKNVQWDDRFSGDPADRITAHELTVAGHASLLVIGAHLRAPVHLNKKDLAEWTRRLAIDIRRIEGDVGHTRTLLIGDLNLNPFDDGLVHSTALHALMSRRLLEVVERMRSRRGYLPFYNPMWSLLGDHRNGRAAGTFFHENSQSLASYFWQMLDQLLIRSDLKDALTGLEILESDGQNRLVSRSGRPRRELISDHLPLQFNLKLTEGAHNAGDNP